MNAFTKITFRLFKYPPQKVEDVFTPAKAANVNYIERTKIDTQLASEMSIPGRQIVVFGHSGSGKTSSVLNLLSKNKYRYIKTQCESSTTFEQLLLNAFDQLDKFVISEKSHKRGKVFEKEIAAEYKAIKGSIKQQESSEYSTTLSRLLPPQLTSQKLSQFMGEGSIVWLIEDFHKVSPEEKIHIADVIKIFVDNANDYPISKIICIGACESANELVQLDPNLRTRISEVHVPLLSDDEIKKIIINGFTLLNVIPSQSLIEKLVYYSDRLGALAHQMCLDICRGIGTKKTTYNENHIKDDSFHYAVDGFIKQSEGTLKSIYEAAVKNELGWYILTTFSRHEKDKLSVNTIYDLVNKGRRSFSKEAVVKQLEEFTKAPYNIIYYNSNSESYALSTPFWHRFLRLQFSIEKSERSKKKKNKHNPNLSLAANDNFYTIIDERMLELIERLKQISSYTK